YQKNLVRVGLGVRRDLLRRRRGPRDIASGRIADQAGEVADKEDDVMAEVLELPQLVELDRVTQVQVRARRIEAFLDPQRLAALELGGQLGLHQQLVGASLENGELVGDVGRHAVVRMTGRWARVSPDGDTGRRILLKSCVVLRSPFD